MNVFVTGATGWVGSAVIKALLAAGHQVTGLARSPEKALPLAAQGLDFVYATLDDLDTLAKAAGQADAVIHTAFNHDFSKFAANAQQDYYAIGALGDALAGSSRPLLVTSGLSGLPLGATEADRPKAVSPRKSEQAAQRLAERGINVATVRLAPSVHGLGEHGFVSMLIELAKQTGVSAYLSDGKNFWSGVYRDDAAQVYRLALEKNLPQSVYHAVADEAVPFKAIATVIGNQLGLPVVSREAAHFGWFASMVGANMAASSDRTRDVLDWQPTGPRILMDLDQPPYYV